jgi:hypothetical protein
MGTYLYSLAKRNITATLPNGAEVKLFNFPYRFKPSGSWSAEKRQEQVMKVHERTAEKVMERPDFSGHIVLDGFSTGRSVRYSYVYKLNDGVWLWYDSNPFPGTLIGFVDNYDKRWIVRSQGRIPGDGQGLTSILHEQNATLMLPVKSDTEFYGPPPEVPQWTPSSNWPYAQVRSSRNFPQPEFLNGWKAKPYGRGVQLTPIFYDTGEFVLDEEEAQDRWLDHFRLALDELDGWIPDPGEEIIL